MRNTKNNLGAPLLNLVTPGGEWRTGEDRLAFVAAAAAEDTLRACVACPEVYRGPSSCPGCGEPGEPLECAECGEDELRFNADAATVDCVGCGADHARA